MPRIPASYRDPAGHVHLVDGKIYRSILPYGVANYEATRQSGFLEKARASGWLIDGHEVDPSVLAADAPDAAYVVEHPRLPYISYPYNWSFDALRAAALVTLDVHLTAIDHGLTLSDASAYNVQFVGPTPVFIDLLSLIRYEEGQVWLGYRQFCEQFLNPLLLTARTGVPFQPWYRGTLEGITSTDLWAVLPLKSRLNPLVSAHVGLQSRMQRAVSSEQTARAKKIRLSRTALQNNLRSMRDFVAGLQPPAALSSPWQDYEHTANYTSEERAAKQRFVAGVVAAVQPAVVWDLGCNSGEYSELALQSGARSVIGFEPDVGALNAAYRRAEQKRLAFLPLSVDLTNPPPASGWMQRERMGFQEQANADLVFCLALIHHLVIGRNLPMQEVVAWLVSLAPNGVIEFVPKSDPMAQQLLTWKPAVAKDYEVDNFRAALASMARITSEEVVTSSGRTMFAFSRDAR